MHHPEDLFLRRGIHGANLPGPITGQALLSEKNFLSGSTELRPARVRSSGTRGAARREDAAPHGRLSSRILPQGGGAGALVTPGTEIPEEVPALGAPAKVKGPLAGTPAEWWVRVNPSGYQALARRHKAGVQPA